MEGEPRNRHSSAHQVRAGVRASVLRSLNFDGLIREPSCLESSWEAEGPTSKRSPQMLMVTTAGRKAKTGKEDDATITEAPDVLALWIFEDEGPTTSTRTSPQFRSLG